MAVVFVGCDHVYIVSLFFSLFGNGANEVIGFIIIEVKDGDFHGRQNLFDVRHGNRNILGLGVSVGLVFRVVIVSEGALRVEGYSDVAGFLVLHEIPEGTHEAGHG